MKLPNINMWTALVVVAGIAGTCAMVALKADPTAIAAYSAAFIALSGALSKLFPGEGPRS